MSRTREDGLRWTCVGTDLCRRALDALDDAGLVTPSALPGWSRAHVVAHLDGNARALGNLVTWATSGVETPMYSSMERRHADIETGAQLAPRELRARFAESASILERGLDSVADWQYEVRTAQGRMVPIAEIPWMRAREVMVHSVDLLGGVGFADIPDDFLIALSQDVAGKRSSDGTSPALRLLDPDGSEVTAVAGAGEATTLSGTPEQIASYLTGREPSFGPALPAWL
jgi:maleylpyruvate isomerase